MKNINRNVNISKSKLCNFGSIDYIFLASSLALAIGEELSPNDINILATFFAVLSDELALIAAIEACDSSDSSDNLFVAPVPDAAMTSTNHNKKRVFKKKRIKKRKNSSIKNR